MNEQISIIFKLPARPHNTTQYIRRRNHSPPRPTSQETRKMTPARRCIPYITTSMVSLVIVIVLVAISQIEKVHAFSSRSLHPTPSVVTTRTSVSSLKAVGSNSLVAVTDSNYRDLFGGKKFLLLDACAQWYVRRNTCTKKTYKANSQQRKMQNCWR